ncbi:prepilin peptidase [Tuanshanicoccus yangjingiae]|uniref:prepilin peptidase n=1 Tax=Aerococcaceae bacterium zg-252 TaxID=2796928 RepID=UPI0040632B42
MSWLLLLAIYDLVYLEVTWTMLFISFILSVYLYSLYPQNLLLSLCLWLILESIILIRPNWLGGADSKLFAILSLTLPIQSMPILLATSSMTGLIWIVGRKRLGHSTQTVIPFIPCIATGYVVALLFAYQ